MLAVLLGAGFSKWAADLPLANALFDFQVEPAGDRDVARLAKVEAAKAAWDRLNPEGLAEQFISDVLSGPEDLRRAVLWYVVRRLAEPFLWYERHAGRWRRHVLTIDSTRVRDRPGYSKARKLLAALPLARTAGVITTNYDLLVEYALGPATFRYDSRHEVLLGRGGHPMVPAVVLSGELPLLKLHGSISWDVRGRYSDGRRGLTGDALIVPPAPGKTPPVELQRVWSEAAQALRAARRLLVFGFAFNPYDTGVRELLSQAGKGIDSVMLVDPNPPVERAREIWSAAEVTAAVPPDGNDDIRRLAAWSRGGAFES